VLRWGQGWWLWRFADASVREAGEGECAFGRTAPTPLAHGVGEGVGVRAKVDVPSPPFVPLSRRA